MPLINSEVSLILNWYKNCVISSNDLVAQATTFAIINRKLYVQVITLSTQDNEKLFEQLKLGFKRTINWNKYQSKIAIQTGKPYFDYLNDPSFQGL